MGAETEFKFDIPDERLESCLARLQAACHLPPVTVLTIQMLSSTEAKPPQLDEFLLASDARCRVADLEAAGWIERVLLALP